MANIIQSRRDTIANWQSVNPILAEGEIGFEKQGTSPETFKTKVGDGVNHWNDLPYQSTGGGSSSWGDITGTLSDQTDLQAALDAKANLNGNATENFQVKDPVADNDAANKKYVDDSITAAGGYTDENAQDAVGSILTDTATIDFTYDDTNGQIKADVIKSGLGLTKSDVGLGNVDNTSDADKPVSIATQTALDAKLDSVVAGNNITIDNTDPNNPVITSTASGGASTFIDLTDSPSSYEAGKLVKVNATGDGLIFGDPSGTSVSWGDVAGTLSDQTDLQNALDSKENTFTKNTAFNKDFGTDAGTVSEGNHTHANMVVDANYVHTDNNYTTTEKNKLAGIEENATADQTKTDIDALGIDAATISGHTVEVNVPSNAVFTDTVTSVEDVLTSVSTTNALSANQGKVLKGLIDNINTLLTSDDTTLDELQEIVDYIKQNKSDLENLGIPNIAGLQSALDAKVETSALQELVEDYVDGLVVAGVGITKTYDDTNGALTISLDSTLKSNYDAAYTHSQSAHAPSDAQKNSDITKAEIEAKLTGEITTHIHDTLYEPLNSNIAKVNEANTWTATQTSTMTSITTGTIDTGVTNDFIVTPGADITIDFSNIASGRRGVILLDNSGGHTLSKATKVKDDGSLLSTISTAGVYVLSYISDGTNVYISYTGALS